ncbi:hypothetical protein HBA55_29770 [Pseudomaricurvus alkylphenolicus]|uniref:endonuclease n=1 Tax=Pseudomaricurvus alkylphenolicus TaxID=1306991 RepID=UPI001423168C|nr:endonuclease [Pseudomaricurvus alkylphenolicus]NIB43828.1 hypothetical protein [Pseudomaricurvus alkylphenolicus]
MKWVVSLLLFPALATAQGVIQTYDEARSKYFWKSLYKNGGETLYCGIEFGGGRDHKDKKLHVEHVMPASWIAAHYGCLNRHACPVDAYHYAAADLHNLWPALGTINVDRYNLPYGTVKDEENAQIRQEVCQDAELLGTKYSGVFEPRDSVKGDIARSMFYMELAYGISLGRDRKLYLKWAAKDPVDEMERKRNKAITRIQRRGNPFIEYGDDGKSLKPAEY